MKKFVYFTNIFPHYRKNIWSKLLEQNDFDLDIYYDPTDLNGIQSTPKSNIDTRRDQLHYLKNIVINGVVIWQTKVIYQCLFATYDKVIFLGEMNIISTWIAAVISKLRQKEVIFWSHGLYGKEKAFKAFFRRLFYSLADQHLAYENKGKNRMVEKGFDPQKIHVVYNSLDYEHQLRLFKKLETQVKQKKNELPTLFFIGRLTRQKKIDLLIQAAIALNKKSPKYQLLIVGDGPERPGLEDLAKPLMDKGLIRFEGAVYDEACIASLIYNADLCISPGNIGLTAIHALSYGTPVATHDNFQNQMPEAGAVRDFENGFFF